MLIVAIFAIWASATDAKQRRLPNKLLAPMFTASILCQLARAYRPHLLLYLPWLKALNPVLAPPLTCVYLALILCIALTIIEFLYRGILKRVGLGFGDIKLATIWTMTLGVWGIVALAVGCATGAITSILKGNRTFPLGPHMTAVALALAAAIPILL